MTTTDLKQHLLAAHTRDKKLTFLGFFLILIAVIAIATLLYMFAYEQIATAFNPIIHAAEEMANSPETPFYYKLIIRFVIISLVSIPLFNYISLSKRPKRIDKFIGRYKK